MKRMILIAAVVVLTLTACGTTTEGKSGPGQTDAHTVDLPGGGEVMCVFWVPVDALGAATAEGSQMSCDWAGVVK